MAELERRGLQIWGPQRERALEEFKRTVAGWGLTMPAVEPQVLDLGLGTFDKVGLIEYWIANNEKEGYCGKFLFCFEGQTCPYHHHDFKHETFFVLKGAVDMKVDGKVTRRHQGDIVEMRQGSDHSFTAVGGPALLLEVSKPCQPNDNIFEDKAIGERGIV
jgi:quercetin dioxygenase-like cupin family protein